MVPENIVKLLSSDNIDDNKVGLSLLYNEIKDFHKFKEMLFNWALEKGSLFTYFYWQTSGLEWVEGWKIHEKYLQYIKDFQWQMKY